MTDDDRHPEPARTDLARLLALVTRLRAPDGCPWDREQSAGDVRAYLLEEAHEVAAALDAGSWTKVAEELGDLLFQVAFLARLGEEAGALDPGAVVDGILSKMVSRHPHVFGGEALPDAAAVARAWERRKLAEARGSEEAGGDAVASLLDGVPASLPALLAAYRMTQKAAGVGFDWPDAGGVLAKLDEEIAELRAELGEETGGTPGDRRDAGVTAGESSEARDGETRGGEAGGGERGGVAAGETAAPGDDSAGRVAEELGDLLFTAANLARKLGVDPEAALAAANRKFRRRFGEVERGLAARGKTPAESSLDEMDALWEEAKR